MRQRVRVVVAIAVAVTVGVPRAGAAQAVPAPSDTVQMSLADALARAQERSEEVRIAEAQVDQAEAQVASARSELLPQVNTQLSYTRALRSVFQGTGFEIPDSLRFEPDSLAPVLDRIRYLENNADNAAFEALGGLFGDLPFGREHTWNALATVQQPVFSMRIFSAVQLAGAAAEAALARYEEAVADVSLSVADAYLAAALAEESAHIVEASVALATAHLAQVRLQLDAGVASELDVLRADVELENLRPQLAQANNARDLAASNLKRLVNLPADTEVALTTPLSTDAGDLPAVGAIALPSLAEAEPQLARRASIRAAQAQIEIRRQQVDIARAAFYPTVNLSGNFGRQAFPSGVFPSGGDWRDDWNVGLSLSWPLFQGFRRKAELDAARAQVQQAELESAQLEEGVRLEYDGALRELERAQLQIEAALRTVAQAQRVYELTELRFREGLATQLDVSDARLALQQARLNQATAYHDYYLGVARAQRALGQPVMGVQTR